MMERAAYTGMQMPTKLADQAPSGEKLSDYDMENMTAYWRMLDAAREGADWREVSKIVLSIDPDEDPERARRAYDSHLARARWLADSGYKQLLRPLC